MNVNAAAGEWFQFSTLGVYEKAISSALSLEEKLNLARESGFDFVEICIDATDARLSRLYATTAAPDVRRAVANTGFPIKTMALTALREFPLGSRSCELREKGKELVRKSVEFASETGIRLILIASYDESPEMSCPDTEKLFVESLCDVVRNAAGAGVILALETVDYGFMTSGENISALLRAIDSPYLQCYADIGNLTACGRDPAKDILSNGNRIVSVHLKDAHEGLYRDVPYGEGIVDFDRCLRALASIDYNGFFVAEMWSHDDDAFHPYLLRANGFLREKLTGVTTPLVG